MSIPQRQPHAIKLTHATEFRAALAAECRLSGRNFLLRAIANSLPRARLGLIASRKAARRAVDRNRGKRQAREAFRAACRGSGAPSVPGAPGATGESAVIDLAPGLPAVDVVLQLKNDLRETSNADLRKELDRLLRDMAARYGSHDKARAVSVRGVP